MSGEFTDRIAGPSFADRALGPSFNKAIPSVAPQAAPAAMTSRDVLTLLFPLEMGPVFNDKLSLIGKYLDEAEARIKALLSEMFPDATIDLLEDWERICALTPSIEDVIQSRRDNVVAQLRARGGMSIQYFKGLAQALGFNITIEELRGGEDGYADEGIFRWRIVVTNQPIYYFRAGSSRAGDRLAWTPSQGVLEGLFEPLKPAHTQLIVAYV